MRDDFGANGGHTPGGTVPAQPGPGAVRWWVWVAGALPLAILLGCGGGGSPSSPEDPGLPEPEGIHFDASAGVYFGSYDWVEYRPGTIPIVLSAGHGGGLEPVALPDRRGPGIVTVRDSRTIETTEAVADALEELLGEGARPHVVISHLRRTKLDPNREIGEAALGDPNAERAWREYHALIDSAKARVVADNGAGFYLDMHGHGHPIQRLELGYLLTRDELIVTSDSAFDALDGEGTSIRSLAERTDVPFSELLRGETSIGGMLEAREVRAVPSTRWASPAPGEPFFSGGYSTRRHGSVNGGPIDGLQIEHNFEGIRDSAANRAAYAAELAVVLRDWIDRWY